MKKTTQDLLEEMKSTQSYQSYLASNREHIGKEHMTIDKALNLYVASKGLQKADVIAKSGIETHYAYQIFSGSKKPSLDKVIMLCFGLSLTFDEVQKLLKTAGYPQLYTKNERDNAIIYGLIKRLSLLEVNEILFDLGLDILE